MTLAMRYFFYTADVFTDRIFGGNPLAVFPEAAGLSDRQMQQVAAEFNYSETVFVFPPQTSQGTRQLRIFTPQTELPFAGHPTVGTAFVLAAIAQIPLTGDQTQIIFEEESKGTQNLLPVNFLRNLIRFYGDQMQSVVPGFLDFSLDNLMKDQGNIRQQMLDAMGVGEPFKGMEEQAKRSMAMFNDAVKMFNPFASMMSNGMPGMGAGMPGMGGASAAKPHEQPAASKDDLQALKDQLAAMQNKLDNISR